MSATFNKATEHRMATWYDTLRDLVPALHGFRATVRLYAGEFEWCSIDAMQKKDRQLFFTVLGGGKPARRAKTP